MRIEVLHGPNLNLLGTREPEIYGSTRLEELDAGLRALAEELGAEVESYQSNHEGALIDRVQERAGSVAGFLVNAGGYTHTSIALRDALVGVGRPFVEVHISNTQRREPFRRDSLLAPVAVGSVIGFGAESYALGLRGLVLYLEQSKRG